MGKHWFGPHGETSKGKGHPLMYGKPKAALHFDPFPDGGGYPIGFLEWAFEAMGVKDPESVLHLCSGSVRTGTTVDIRPETGAKIVADCRATGLPDESFDFILADPPYAEDYAENLYGTGRVYPKPGEILKEATRLLRPGGKVGLLHFIVPMIRKPLKILGVYGITTGSGYAIRAWTLKLSGLEAFAAKRPIKITGVGRRSTDGICAPTSAAKSSERSIRISSPRSSRLGLFADARHLERKRRSRMRR